MADVARRGDSGRGRDHRRPRRRRRWRHGWRLLTDRTSIRGAAQREDDPSLGFAAVAEVRPLHALGDAFHYIDRAEALEAAGL
jgi:hypothetical protein